MSEQREALAEAREYHRHGDSIDLVPGAAETCVYIKSEPRDMLALAPDALARLLADAEQRGAERVAVAVGTEALLPIRRFAEAQAVTARSLGRDDRDWLDVLHLLDGAHALTTGAADRVRAEALRVESLHEELLRGDDDADQLRAVIFRLAEDVTRLKRVCHQEHPPKMGSPTRDWPAGTETRHSDGARCVLLNDGDYTLIHSPGQEAVQ